MYKRHLFTPLITQSDLNLSAKTKELYKDTRGKIDLNKTGMNHSTISKQLGEKNLTFGTN